MKNQYKDLSKELVNSLYEEAQMMIKERVLYYGGLVDQKINDFVEELLDSIYEEMYVKIKESEKVNKGYSIAEKICSTVEAVKDKITDC